MAISNYAELQTAVGNYLHRGDLTSLIPDFISLAEAKINRELRIRAMENTTTGSITSSVALPTGFVELISLTASSGGYTWPLTYISPSQVIGGESAPNFYSLVGDNIKFEPAGSGYTYTMNYYKKFDALSAGVNWLITNAPDLYLYATLVEAYKYIGDMPNMEKMIQLGVAVSDQLTRSDNRDRFGSDLMVVTA